MAQLYGPHYDRLWKEALLLPGHSALLDSLAEEAGSFFGMEPAQAKQEMERAWVNRPQRMMAGMSAASDAAQLAEYYRTAGRDDVLSSLYWHALAPNRWALHSVAALQDVQQFAEGNRVFELGHGVGSTAILFARHGFEVAALDVSTEYREFTRHRLRSRGLEASILEPEAAPPAGTFDACVSLDVLEHVRRPLRLIETMWRCLRPGGVMVLNIVFGRDPSNPEHILRWRTGVLNRIRTMGFERVPATLLVFFKRDVRGLRRWLYAAQDTAHSLLEDAAAQVPGLSRLTRIAVPPPLH
jgi:SAM-dependent methyltransferase